MNVSENTVCEHSTHFHPTAQNNDAWQPSADTKGTLWRHHLTHHHFLDPFLTFGKDLASGKHYYVMLVDEKWA